MEVHCLTSHLISAVKDGLLESSVKTQRHTVPGLKRSSSRWEAEKEVVESEPYASLTATFTVKKGAQLLFGCTHRHTIHLVGGDEIVLNSSPRENVLGVALVRNQIPKQSLEHKYRTTCSAIKYIQ